MKILFLSDNLEKVNSFRLNNGGAHLPYNLEPDAAVFATGMSNGYPMAAIIGKSDVMEVVQDTFISSTYWTDRVGPTAALATIRKIKEKNVSGHLIKIGKKMTEGWESLASRYDLNIEVSGIDPLAHFDLKYDNPLVLKTLFTQLMLEKDFLASTAFYASFAYKEEHIESYLKAADEAFGFISTSIADGNTEKYLKGPVCHAGFKRLT